MPDVLVYKTIKNSTPDSLLKLSGQKTPEELANIVTEFLDKHYNKIKKDDKVKSNLLNLVDFIFSRTQDVASNDIIVLKPLFSNAFMNKLRKIYPDES